MQQQTQLSAKTFLFSPLPPSPPEKRYAMRRILLIYKTNQFVSSFVMAKSKQNGPQHVSNSNEQIMRTVEQIAENL